MIERHLNSWPKALRFLTLVLAGRREEIDAFAPALDEQDWRDFLHLAQDRHKVVALVADRLSGHDLPKHVSEFLSSAAQLNAMTVLKQIACTGEIAKAFQATGIEVTVLKGWPLSEDLFGTASMRHSRDIDLILAAGSVVPAADILQDLGFSPVPDGLRRFRMIGTPVLEAEMNNLSFRSDDGEQLVELHWRCHQFAGWPELFENGSNTRLQATAAGTLRVPDEQCNLVYLAVHGSLHRWSRLKWLCDIAALASRRGPKQLEQDVAFASELGAGRPLELALFLSNSLFGSPSPETRYLSRPWLAERCLDEIARPDAVVKSLAERARFYSMCMALAAGTRQRLGVLRYRLWGKHRLALADFRQAG